MGNNAATITRNALWNLVDTALGVVSVIVCSVMVARVMGPAKLGYYQYVIWIASMTGIVASLGVPAATRKFVAEYLGREEHAVARAILRTTFRFQCYMALAVGVIGLTVVFTIVAPERRVWAALAALSAVPQLIMAVISAAIIATEDLRPNVRVSVISTLANLAGVVLTLLLGWDLPGLSAALLVSRVLDCVLRYLYYRRIYGRMPARDVIAPIPPDVRVRLVRFCWHSTVLLALDLVVWNRSEMFFLERYSDITQVAYYSISFNIVEQLLVLPRVLAWSADTTMIVQQGRAPSTVAKLGITTGRFMALFSIPAAFGLAALCDPIMRLVYGTKYVAAIPVLMVTALFSVGRALQLPAQRLLSATENQSFMVRWGLLLAGVNVVTSLLLVPSGGAVGAAFSKGIVQTVAMVGMWAYTAKTFRVGLPVGRFVGLLIASTVMFGAVWLAARLVPGNVLPLLLGIPLGAAVIVPLLRLTRYLGPEDRSRLAPLERRLPSSLRSVFARMVLFVAPGPAVAQATPGVG